jgi:hypothetical protein
MDLVCNLNRGRGADQVISDFGWLKLWHYYAIWRLFVDKMGEWQEE